MKGFKSFCLFYCKEMKGKRVFLFLLSLVVFAIVFGAERAQAGINTWTTNGPYGGAIMSLAIDPVNPNTLYAGTSGGGIFRSTDSGVTWSPAITGSAAVTITALAIDPSAPSTLYAGTNGGIFRSTDSGVTWSSVITGSAAVTITALAIDPSAPSTLYAGTNGGIFRSTDSGVTWSSVITGSATVTITALAIDPSAPSTLYAGTYQGMIFKSIDGGANWAVLNAGLTDMKVMALAVAASGSGILYAATHGGIVFLNPSSAASDTLVKSTSSFNWDSFESAYQAAKSVTMPFAVTITTADTGSISGTVTDGATGIQNIMVIVFNAAGSYLSDAYTDVFGTYTAMGVPTGNWSVAFFSGNTGYISQLYNNQPFISTATPTPVAVTAPAATSGINATLSLGGSISGTVTSGGSPVQNVLVWVYDTVAGAYLNSSTYNLNGSGWWMITSTSTDANGYYIFKGVPTGSYKVFFTSTNYYDNWYNSKSDITNADVVSVTSPGTTANINTTLVLYGTTYVVTPSAGAGGTISPNTPVTVNYGSTTSFTVTPNTGYSISSVTGCGGTLSGNTYTTGPITANCSVSASFAANTFTVTPSAGAGGTISPNTPVTVNYGATTSFTVTPNTGYSISSVTGCGGTLSGNTYTTGPITANCTVSAVFSANPVNGVCGSSNGGTFTTAPTGNLCLAGTASAVSGSGPWTWTCKGANGGTNASCSAGIQSFTVTPSAGTGGTISPNTPVTVNYGATTSFTVTPNAGYSIASVSGCGGTLSGNTYRTGPITANCSVSASFVASTFTVTASAGVGGSISPSSATVNSGNTTSFTVTPNTGYHIASVTGCYGTLRGNTYTTGPITANCSVTAAFANTFTVTPVVGSHGTIDPAGPIEVPAGRSLTISISPDPGYIANVVIDGVPIGSMNKVTFFNVTGPHTIEVTFTLK